MNAADVTWTLRDMEIAGRSDVVREMYATKQKRIVKEIRETIWESS